MCQHGVMRTLNVAVFTPLQFVACDIFLYMLHYIYLCVWHDLNAFPL